MTDEYLEMLFAVAAIFTLFALGLLLCHGIGLVIMKLRSIRTGKRRTYLLRREL